MKTIGKKLRQFRSSFNKKVTLNDLAKYSGLSQPYLSMVENDKKVPTVNTFFSIIEALAIFGENLYHYDFDSDQDAIDNRLAWTKDMLDDFLDDFGYQNKSHEWIPSEKLPDQEDAIFEATAKYRQIDRDEFPLEYINQLKNSTVNQSNVGDLNQLINFIPYSLDLNIFFDDKSMKKLSLSLDGVPLSKVDLETIKNTLNGIRFTNK